MLEQIYLFLLNHFISLLKPLWEFFQWAYRKLPFRIVPKKTPSILGLIENSRRPNMWSLGLRNNEEIVSIQTSWIITNALPYNITALNAYLIKPEKVQGFVLIRNPEENIWGNYAIGRGYTTEIDISFVINKKFAPKKDSKIKINFELQDALGKTHKVKAIEVPPSPIQNSIKPVTKDKVIIEDISKIQDNTIKKVVSILKNEIVQYRVRGRREGRLGTVEWIRGVLEYRAVDEKIKFLYENSNPKNLFSEHVNALLGLYKNSTKKEKEKIVKSVLERINKKTEYRDVAYLIIFFLFEIKQLDKGLKVALEKLYRDKANGFSDVLRLLDFLLAFRYDEINEKDLDAIEKFAYTTKEYPFQIKERVNAIRVMNL